MEYEQRCSVRIVARDDIQVHASRVIRLGRSRGLRCHGESSLFRDPYLRVPGRGLPGWNVWLSASMVEKFLFHPETGALL